MTAPNPVSDCPFDPHERSTWEIYYGIQYQRIAQQEGLRTQVSAAVIAASGVAFGVAGLTRPAPWVVIPIMVAGVLANSLAALLANNSRRWVKVHQERAATALARMSPCLAKLNAEVNARMFVGQRARDRNARVRSDSLLIGIHLTLIALAIGLAFILPSLP